MDAAVNEMAGQIEAIVKGMGGSGVSFVDLEEAIPGMPGERVLYAGTPEENRVLWTNVSGQFTEALRQLLAEQRVFLQPTPFLTYTFDGAMLALPIAKTARAYKKPHWVPVTLSIGSA